MNYKELDPSVKKRIRRGILLLFMLWGTCAAVGLCAVCGIIWFIFWCAKTYLMSL